MAVQVRPGLGVVVYHFWPLRILTPSRLDRSTGPLARTLNQLGITRSRCILLEDLV